MRRLPAAELIADLDASPTELLLNYSINFAPQGMAPNQSSIGEYINQVMLAGGTPVVAGPPPSSG